MPNGPTLEDALRGVQMDHRIATALRTADFPEYVIVEFLSAGGLEDLHSRIDTESQDVVQVLTAEAIGTYLESEPSSAADAPADEPDTTEKSRDRTPFLSTLGAHFPPPLIARGVRRAQRPQPPDEESSTEELAAPLFEERALLDMEATRKEAFLLRAQEALDRRRQEGGTADLAIREIATALAHLIGDD